MAEPGSPASQNGRSKLAPIRLCPCPKGVSGLTMPGPYVPDHLKAKAGKCGAQPWTVGSVRGSSPGWREASPLPAILPACGQRVEASFVSFQSFSGACWKQFRKAHGCLSQAKSAEAGGHWLCCKPRLLGSFWPQAGILHSARRLLSSQVHDHASV